MSLEITAVGGFNEIGRQSTAIKIDEQVFIIDLGLHLDHYIRYNEDCAEDLQKKSVSGLRKAGAIPDWSSIRDWKKNVSGIILTHAHLDHIGAVPYLAHLFDCPIYGTPFTIALLKQILLDNNMDLPNELVSFRGSLDVGAVKVEFIRSTHSTLDTAMVALHTRHGIVVIDNDYKLDNNPTLGLPPDVARLKELQGKVICHIGECLYAPAPAKTPSEQVARQLLEEVLLETNTANRAVFVSAFSSNVARLYSIMHLGQAMGRKVVFLGRSMAKYLLAAQETGLIDIPESVLILKYGSEANSFFKKNKDLSGFLVVCTGHMGEPKAALSKLLDGQYPFKFKQDDIVVLSSKIIPVPHIIANRKDLLRRMHQRRLRVFDEVHVSGHASKEDIRFLLETLSPLHVIPNHGVSHMTHAFIDLAREMAIEPSNIHDLREGDRVTLIK